MRTGIFSMLLLLLACMPGCNHGIQKSHKLFFSKGENNEFTFQTGELSGVFRLEGASIGLVPVLFGQDRLSITNGEGLFNHYRVFTRGKRYGYGARRWPSTAELQADGSADVFWPDTTDRPFELSATYRWVTPNTLDVTTTVQAVEKLEAFEVFLASYYTPGFTDSRVWASEDPREGGKAGFVSADRELGEWLAFPRDHQAAEVIEDGRWELGSSPLDWTLMPPYQLPLAFRRDVHTGTTVVVMAEEHECFGIFTPYGEEKHYSNYLSLFGYDVEAGETVSALTRLVVLSNPSEREILDLYDTFTKTIH
jgi:hypothetical protein